MWPKLAMYIALLKDVTNERFLKKLVVFSAVLLTTRDNVTVVSNDDTHDDTRVTVSWNTGGGGRPDERGVVVRQIVYWCLSRERGGVGGGVCLVNYFSFMQ